MADTVIDSLIVKLGLDAKQFQVGQESARREIDRTRDTAERDAKDRKKRETEAEAEARKVSEANKKRQQEMEARTKQVGETLNKARNAALGLLGAFTAGAGIQAFVGGITNANAALGRLAPNMGMSVEALSAWQNAAKALGGSAEGVTASLQGLVTQFQDLRHGKMTSAAPWLQMLGVGPEQIKTAEGGLKAIGDALIKWRKAHSQEDTAYMASQLGLNAETFNLITSPNRDALLAQGRKAGVTKEDADAAGKIQTAWEQLRTSSERLGTTLTTQLSGPLTMVLTKLREMADWLNLPEHRTMLDVFFAVGIAGAVKFTVGLFNVANKLLGLNSIASTLMGGSFGALLGMLAKLSPALIALGLMAPSAANGQEDADIRKRGLGGAGTPMTPEEVERYRHSHPGENNGTFGGRMGAIWEFLKHQWGFGSGAPLLPFQGVPREGFHPASYQVESGAAPTGNAPRGIRNNNPGNLEFAGQEGASREAGGGGRFAAFGSMAEGVAALAGQLQRYASRGMDTIRSIIERYAPSSENDTGGYITQLARSLGVSPDAHLDMNDPNVLRAMISGISRVENGSGWLGSGQIDQGLSRMHASRGGATHNQTNVHIQITAPSGDARAIARETTAAIARHGLVAQANTGLA